MRKVMSSIFIVVFFLSSNVYAYVEKFNTQDFKNTQTIIDETNKTEKKKKKTQIISFKETFRVYFKSNEHKSHLFPYIENQVDQFLGLFLKVKVTNIEIHCHTDTVGSIQYNQILSTNRCRSVYESVLYILKLLEIQPPNIKMYSYGESTPHNMENSKRGRLFNRRTDVIINGFGIPNPLKVIIVDNKGK